MNKLARTSVALSFCALVATGAQASIVVDGSPTGPLYNSGWTNVASSQNFLVRFTLANSTDITGFDLFNSAGSLNVGSGVTVRIRSDVAGNPNTTNLFEFNDAIDSELAFGSGVDVSTVNFGAITLAAGTYWMGVSGITGGTWASYNNGGPLNPSYQRQLSGNTIQFAPNIWDLAYRIHGTMLNSVPEPTSLVLAGLALAGLAATRRRH